MMAWWPKEEPMLQEWSGRAERPSQLSTADREGSLSLWSPEGWETGRTLRSLQGWKVLGLLPYWNKP